MKKSIITGILFLAIVSISAQEKGTKNTKPIKYTKGTNSSVIVEKEIKTTTPISIRPTNSNSTNRAAVNSTNSKEVNTARPEKVKVNTNRAARNSNETTRPEKVKVNTNRAAQTSVETTRPEKVNTNRAAQTSVETTRPEKVKVNNERNSINKEEKPLKEEFNKLSVDYCKGWKEGYIKAWSKSHKGEKLEFVPNCKTTGNCEGYKCGFKAGMKQAELNIR